MTQLLETLIEQAYAERGDTPLTQEQTDALVNECIETMEKLTDSQTQAVQQEQ